ncbi:hypothetical protein PIB30_023961 [Stylosanthes scabra]|uniref:Uncharacterized protein n=1 Tax=Stylosanthes scabra TaxID=79078 RepID=A0ABU6X9M2_9FABA|nr:hypothetical protein [Stylosanthes scabra]
MNIKAIDIWSAIQKRKDWRDVFFNDGIHLTAEESEIVVREILKACIGSQCQLSLEKIRRMIRLPPMERQLKMSQLKFGLGLRV